MRLRSIMLVVVVLAAGTAVLSSTGGNVDTPALFQFDVPALANLRILSVEEDVSLPYGYVLPLSKQGQYPVDLKNLIEHYRRRGLARVTPVQHVFLTAAFCQQPDTMLHLAQQLAHRVPGEIITRRLLAKALQRCNRLREARQAYGELLRLHDLPPYVRAQASSGAAVVLAMLGEEKTSRVYIQDAIDLNREHDYPTELGAAYNNSGVVFWEAGAYADAAAAFDTARLIFAKNAPQDRRGDFEKIARMNTALVALMGSDTDSIWAAVRFFDSVASRQITARDARVIPEAHDNLVRAYLSLNEKGAGSSHELIHSARCHSDSAFYYHGKLNDTLGLVNDRIRLADIDEASRREFEETPGPFQVPQVDSIIAILERALHWASDYGFTRQSSVISLRLARIYRERTSRVLLTSATLGLDAIPLLLRRLPPEPEKEIDREITSLRAILHLIRPDDLKVLNDLLEENLKRNDGIYFSDAAGRQARESLLEIKGLAQSGLR